MPYGPLVQVHTPFNPALAPDPHTLDLQYDYDALGQVSAVHDAVNLQTGTRSPYSFYIADGTRGERDDPLGGAYSVVYDTYRHASQYIDELGRVTLASFDSRGRATSYTYPEHDCETFAYDDRNNTTDSWRVDKVSSCNTGAGTAHVLHVGATWDPTWNKPLSLTNARGVTTTFTYYASGNGASLMATAVRPADGVDNGPATYSFTYTSIGKPLTATDPDGVATASAYDSAGNLTSTTLDPSNISIETQFAYDATGNVISTTDPRGFVTTSTYDADRRKLEDDRHNGSASAALLAATQSVYDAQGRVVDAKAAKTVSGTSVTSWITTHTTFTPTSKPATVTDPDNRTIVTAYDALDRVVTVTDPVGKSVHSTYDAAGQLLIEYRGWGTPLQQAYATHSYTPNGKEHSVFDALGGGHLTTYAYDGFDRLSSTVFADASHEDLSYDEDGNITSRATRAGPVLTYAYDLLDRLRTKQIPLWNDAPAHQVTWSYTLAGRTTMADDAAGQASVYLIDTAGRTTDELATAVAQGGTLHVAWTFDKAGNRTKLTWPDGYAVDYAFDGLDRMVSAVETGGSQLASYAYNPLSRRAGASFNGGTSAMTYSYTDAGDILTLTDDLAGTANDVTYTSTYTPAHQLQTVSTSNPVYVWSPSAASSTYVTVNNLNQYPSIDGSAMSWDGSGNLLSTGGAAQIFAHDAENRMLTTAGSGVASSYLYDPDGRRTVKSVQTPEGTTTRFLHEGPDEIGEYNQFGGLTRRFVPGTGIDDYIAMELPGVDDGLPGSKTFFHTDRQGSVIAMADTSGNLAEGPYTYDTYGNCFLGASTTSCNTLPTTVEPFRYTGQRFDAETGLYYYRARYYHPGIGRFAETDSVGYGPDVNWYTYVGNDPINRSDPTGAVGVFLELNVKIAIPEQKVMGVTVIPSYSRSIAVGIAISAPSLTVSVPPGIPVVTLRDNAKSDIGFYARVGAGVHDFEKSVRENPEAGGSADVIGGIFRGSVSDIAGKGADFGGTVEPVSLDASINSSGQLSSVGAGPGQGLMVGLGAQATIAGTASVNRGLQGAEGPAKPLPSLSVCAGTSTSMCGKIK